MSELEFRTCAELESDGLTTECVWSSCVYAGKCQRRCDPTDPFIALTALATPEGGEWPCPWCARVADEGHDDDCPNGPALEGGE